MSGFTQQRRPTAAPEQEELPGRTGGKLIGVAWAEDQRLIGVEEIGGVTYLWLINSRPESGEQDDR